MMMFMNKLVVLATLLFVSGCTGKLVLGVHPDSEPYLIALSCSPIGIIDYSIEWLDQDASPLDE